MALQSEWINFLPLKISRKKAEIQLVEIVVNYSIGKMEVIRDKFMGMIGQIRGVFNPLTHLSEGEFSQLLGVFFSNQIFFSFSIT